MSDKRQKNQLPLACTEEGRSEAPRSPPEGTESFTAKCETESPARAEQLMEEVCGRENCQQALRRVKANKGSPGIDGMKVAELPGYLKQHWPALREQLSTTPPMPIGGNYGVPVTGFTRAGRCINARGSRLSRSVGSGWNSAL